jgi:flavorubredoxin
MVAEIAAGVHWVGVVDWALRFFHGYELSTHRGSSYNAYLIRDEKTVLIDTVWEPFTKEFIEKLRVLVDPSKIDVVVCNHAEIDHAGALPAVMELCPQAMLVVSKRGAETVPGHYHRNWPMHVVGTGDRLNIGRRDLVFVEAPMLHWPDSMFTYLTGDAILFPNDAFGQHYATAFRFNDQVDGQALMYEAMKYYANIITPFSKMVTRKIDELRGLGLPLKAICPSHGVMWRDNPMQIVDAYYQWAQQKGSLYALVLYDTMWNATRRMAEAIGDGLNDQAVDHKLFHMAVSDRNDVLTEVFRAKAVVVGSPTLNNGLLPGISPILEDLKGLKFVNKLAAAFGSYGWSGECVKIIEGHLQACKFPLVAPGVLAKWQPTADDLQKCRELGRAVGAAVKAAGPEGHRP